jgi:hypothetical protein
VLQSRNRSAIAAAVQSCASWRCRSIRRGFARMIAAATTGSSHVETHAEA